MAVVPLAVQLYSVRELAGRNLPVLLDRLVACGYEAVEPFQLHGALPAEFAALLRKRGLAVVGFHVDLNSNAPLERTLDALAELGTRRVVVPWTDPERFSTLDDVERLAERLNGVREVVSRWNMTLGYHNHWWEFARRAGGRTLHELLFERLHPAVFAEIDVYWTAVGGCDPVQVLGQLGARAALVHLKDGPADGEDSLMTAVGEGRLDMPAIVAAAEATEAHIVEIDACAGDMMEALARSAEYLRGLRSASSARK